MAFYYTTQGVRGPITKINRSRCSITGPIFSKYRTGHCPEWSRTCVFAVFAFFSRVINLLLTKLARNRTERISALCLFCTDLAALGPYCQDLGPIFSQYSPRAWLIRNIYQIFTPTLLISSLNPSLLRSFPVSVLPCSGLNFALAFSQASYNCSCPRAKPKTQTSDNNNKHQQQQTLFPLEPVHWLLNPNIKVCLRLTESPISHNTITRSQPR